jgi:hypothetical protein
MRARLQTPDLNNQSLGAAVLEDEYVERVAALEVKGFQVICSLSDSASEPFPACAMDAILSAVMLALTCRGAMKVARLEADASGVISVAAERLAT